MIIKENRTLDFIDLGTAKFAETWDLQKSLFTSRVENKITDTLLFVEHPNVYTIGKAGSNSNIVADAEFISQNEIEIFEIDRGGDVTFHGLGQIVGYPIINLAEWEKDIHKYLRAIEEVIINVCKEYDINATRNPEYTGVWVGENKICAIGVKVSRWVTMHGFAFNVNTNLNLFNGIIPCGIKDKGVTSLEKEIGRKINIDVVKKSVLNNFAKVFGYDKINVREKEDLLVEI